MRTYQYLQVLAPAVLIAGAGALQTASAQDSSSAGGGIEEIVVTAQKREENLQKVPITISVFSAEQLAQSSVKTIDDLSSLVPGFSGPGSSGTNTPHIRGVGNGVISPGNDQGVSYYLDGVYIPTGLTAPLYFNDLAQVQVLKGPQGTLFGRNATAGAVLLTTKDPGREFEGEAELGYGDYGTVSGAFYMAGPVTNRVRASLAISASHQSDGWGDNLVTGEDTGKIDQQVSAHSKWIFDFSDDTSLTLGLDYERIRGVGLWDFRPFPKDSPTPVGPVSLGDNRWNTALNRETPSLNNGGGVMIRIDHDLHFAKFSNTLAYRAATNDTVVDSDGTPADLLQLVYYQNARQISNELQLASTGDGRLEWTVGAFFLQSEDTGEGHIALNGGALILPLNALQDTRSLSVYAQGTYKFADDRTRLTLGGRYTSEQRDLTPKVPPLLGVKTTLNANVPTWRIALDHQLTDDVLIYASVSRGFKSGGFGLTTPTDPPFNPEYLTAYEVGTKTTWFNNRLRLNVSGFYYDYKGLQLVALQGAIQTIYNAAAAELYGVDVDFQAKITERFTLSGALEALHSEYTSFPNAQIFTVLANGFPLQSIGSVKGNTLQQAPEFTASLTGAYNLPTAIGDWDFTATYEYNAGHFGSPDNNLEQPSFSKVDASIQWTDPSEKYWIRAWGKNLGNKYTSGILTFGPVIAYDMANAPRTYGVTAGIRF